VTPQARAVPLSRRSALVLAVASAAGLMMLMWPLLVRQASGGQTGPPFVFLALVPVVIVVVLAEVSEGGLDPRVLAVLGVLSAVNAVLRGVSPGTGGVELVFFLLILAGRVFGPGFGFVLGCTSLFASALLTGGVGPWLPYQMLVSAWVGMGAGLLPRRATGRVEIAMLAAYGVVAAYAFGLLLNLSSWPFILGIAVPGHHGLAFVPGDPLGSNLHRFLTYTLITSTGSFDTGRAITNAAAIVQERPERVDVARMGAREPLERDQRGAARARALVLQAPAQELELLAEAKLGDRAVGLAADAVVGVPGGRLQLVVPLRAQRRQGPLVAGRRERVRVLGSLGEGHAGCSERGAGPT
jgi:energy-coupling factor transport system substrate-specific component